jgi:hypothetical protein
VRGGCGRVSADSAWPERSPGRPFYLGGYCGTSVGQSRATMPGNPFTGTVDVSQKGGCARDIRNRGTKPSRSNPDIVCRQSATNINTVRQIARDASAFFTAIGGVAGQPPPSITLSSGGRRLWSTGFMLHERIRDRHSDDGYSQ